MKALLCETPIGLLQIVEDDSAITEIRLADKNLPRNAEETPLLLEAKRQLTEYFFRQAEKL